MAEAVEVRLTYQGNGWRAQFPAAVAAGVVLTGYGSTAASAVADLMEEARERVMNDIDPLQDRQLLFNLINLGPGTGFMYAALRAAQAEAGVPRNPGRRLTGGSN